MPHLVDPVVAAGRMRAAQQRTLDADNGISLVPWHATHSDAVMRAFADPEIQRWHLRAISSTDEAREWIRRWRDAWRAETDASWAVTNAATGRVLGNGAVREINLGLGWAQLTYWVLPAARGAGVASAATRRLVRWSFDDLGLHRLEIVHSLRNATSCRVATNAGGVLEGTLRDGMRHADGWHDMHLHAVINDAD